MTTHDDQIHLLAVGNIDDSLSGESIILPDRLSIFVPGTGVLGAGFSIEHLDSNATKFTGFLADWKPGIALDSMVNQMIKRLLVIRS